MKQKQVLTCLGKKIEWLKSVNITFSPCHELNLTPRYVKRGYQAVKLMRIGISCYKSGDCLWQRWKSSAITPKRVNEEKCLWWTSQNLHVYPAMLSYNIDGFEMFSSQQVHLCCRPGLLATLSPVCLFGLQDPTVLGVCWSDKILQERHSNKCLK